MNFCSVWCRSVGSSFSLLSKLCLLRTFFLEKTGLILKWLVWKQLFLPFLTQLGPTFYSQMGKREAILLPFLVILTLTNYSKLFENVQFFAIFDTNWDKNVALTSFKCGISSYIGLIFPLRYLYIHYVLLL